jgi:hypothetical protein
MFGSLNMSALVSLNALRYEVCSYSYSCGLQNLYSVPINKNADSI